MGITEPIPPPEPVNRRDSLPYFAARTAGQPVGAEGQSVVVVNGNPVVHNSQPEAVGQGNVDVDVTTPKELQPHGAVTNSRIRIGSVWLSSSLLA